ncbi:TPA: DotU family type IV/VI secretion system protein, partial [Pseudomonas putida]|nr:DotU family type IV/VI secretion system protein [Pseudomonas putida]
MKDSTQDIQDDNKGFFESIENLDSSGKTSSEHGTSEVQTEPAFEGYAADPDFQLRGGFANLMLDAAAPLFGLVMRLRTLDELPNIKDVHRQVRNQIDNIREEMRQHGYEHTQLLAYSYGLCLYIDEAVMETPWGQTSCWSQEPLLSIF